MKRKEGTKLEMEKDRREKWITLVESDPKPNSPVSSEEFMECAICRTKPGSPTLCRACLHNRAVIRDKETRWTKYKDKNAELTIELDKWKRIANDNLLTKTAELDLLQEAMKWIFDAQDGVKRSTQIAERIDAFLHPDSKNKEDGKKTVVLTKAEFDTLLEYSLSLPTGTIPGKRWKCRAKGPDNWFLGEYGDFIGGDIQIKWSKIVIVNPKPIPVAEDGGAWAICDVCHGHLLSNPNPGCYSPGAHISTIEAAKTVTYPNASTEPLDTIRANECEDQYPNLATKRFQAFWNEVERLRAELAKKDRALKKIHESKRFLITHAEIIDIAGAALAEKPDKEEKR